MHQQHQHQHPSLRKLSIDFTSICNKLSEIWNNLQVRRCRIVPISRRLTWKDPHWIYYWAIALFLWLFHTKFIIMLIMNDMWSVMDSKPLFLTSSTYFFEENKSSFFHNRWLSFLFPYQTKHREHIQAAEEKQFSKRRGLSETFVRFP